MSRALRTLPALVLAAAAFGPSVATAKPRHAKKAEPAATATATTIPDLAERYIEKKAGAYDVSLVLRPGNLKLRRAATVAVDLAKVLEIPDPVTGDRQPMVSGEPYAIVQGPEVEGRGHRRETPPPVQYRLWPTEERGRFSFHFTPTTDGIYQVTIVGHDPGGDGEDAKDFQVPFRIGAGTAALQTEVSQGAAAVHHEARHPVGQSARAPHVDELRRAMEEIGQRTLDLGAMLREHPSGAEVAAEARAIEALVQSTKGMAPEEQSSEGAEYDRLTAETAQAFEELATSAEAKHGRGGSAVAKYEALAPMHCDECHAKFRWHVTDDLSSWPKFVATTWKKAGGHR